MVIRDGRGTARIYFINLHFWFGEVASAAALAGAITVPLGMFLAEMTGSLFSFTIAAMLFLLLFVFPRVRQNPKDEKNLKGSSSSCPSSFGRG